MYQRTEIKRPSGINQDLSAYELPPETWSDGLNVNFQRNRTARAKGYDNIFAIDDTLIPPSFAIYYTEDNVTNLWAYASYDAINSTDGNTITSLGTGYTATITASWTAVNFNQRLIFNNRNDHPQVLEAGAMQDLPNWDIGVDYPSQPRWRSGSRCEVIRAYKNYLFALDCYDDDQTRYPSMARWSSPAEAGDVPPSWDPYLEGEQAGLYVLADTPGMIVDGLTLGDYFMIYKTDSVWAIQFVGGDFIFSFRKLFSDDAGALAKECIVEFDGRHFVMSPTGAYVHNGSAKQEIMDPWVKDYFFDNVNLAKIRETKVVADHSAKEVLVYFSTKTATTDYADRVLAWDWENAKWSIRELTGISYIAEGYIDPSLVAVDDWDSDSEQWNVDITPWDSATSFNPADEGLLLCDYDNQKLYAYGQGNTLAGKVMDSWVKRIGIDMNDDTSFKYVTRVVPHILGTTPMWITVYTEDTQTGSPVAHGPYEFNPQFDQDIDCHVTGRYMGLKFEGPGAWVLTGYSVEWEKTGVY